jgi:hypothetical protein
MKNEITMHDLIPLRRWCQLVGISYPTAWKWRRVGWLNATVIGGRVFISFAQSQEFKKRAATGEFDPTQVVPSYPKYPKRPLPV